MGKTHAMNQTATRRAGGYPLIALFLVLTGCGIIAALVGPAARAVSEGKIGLADALLSSVIGCVVVMVMGGVIGLFHYRRARGFGWGLLTGAVIGLFVGPLVLAPRESFGTIVSLSMGGAAVILLISAAFRLSSSK
jgi:hypothetical protein